MGLVLIFQYKFKCYLRRPEEKECLSICQCQWSTYSTVVTVTAIKRLAQRLLTLTAAQKLNAVYFHVQCCDSQDTYVRT